jgi:Spy/CpxP family protein refolding chaperone
MRRSYGYGIVAGLIAIGLVATLGAQPPAGGQGMGQGMGGQGMGQGMRGQGMGPGDGPMAALKLTAEQQKAIQAVMQAQRETHQATMKQVRDLRKQLHETIFSGSGDEGAAFGLANEIAALEANVRVRMQFAVAAVLTPEQRKIVIEHGIEFPPAQMGPGVPGGRGGRGGQQPVKK